MTDRRWRLDASVQEWVPGERRGDCILRWAADDVVRILLADAAGHDEKSARIVGYIRPFLEHDLRQGWNGRVFRVWSDLVFRRFGEDSLFVCFTAIELNRSMQLLKIANAGNPDVLLRADNKLERFSSTGMPLGLLPGNEWLPPRFQYTRLRDGDCALCFSDGLVDRVGVNGDRFGLMRICSAARAGGRSVLRLLRRSLRRFSSAAAEQDDLAVVLLATPAAA